MNGMTGGAAPFQLPASVFSSLPGFASGRVRVLCERMLSLPGLNDVYRRSLSDTDPQAFCNRVLQALGLTIDVSDDALRQIPTSGPLIVAANHPFGGVDGLILPALLQRVRPDVRLLANYLLRRMPEMHEICFFVDPFGGPDAPARNRGAMKSALKWLRDGGALGIFPAGEVSHFTLRRGSVSDPHWDDSVARLARSTAATVLPVFFEGGNSRAFQLAGLVHPRLRTAMLPRELLRMRGRRVRVEIGSPIPYGRLARFAAPDGGDELTRRAEISRMTEYLRVRTYVLRGRQRSAEQTSLGANNTKSPLRSAQPLIRAVSSAIVAAEIDSLPVSQCLAASGSLRALYGDARQLPNALQEIGRLRELTYRAAGEGTGRDLDLDRFDPHYLHLLLWNADRRQIVGAYRMGQTDELLKRFGAAGLYTSTLFRYRPRLLEQLTPALELGRSFIVPEYQRDYTPLSLLWKGIGRFVAQRPHYRILFGAVSISDEFQSLTKQLLVAFLKTHNFDAELAALVRAKRPPRLAPFRDADENYLATLVRDLADVEELVSEIEHNRRGVPVLLRQYLRLNAKLLGFNLDPDFGDVLDGLVLVDLTCVERPILNRYLGADGAAAFLAHHHARPSETHRA